jgi:hypothetical protein
MNDSISKWSERIAGVFWRLRLGWVLYVSLRPYPSSSPFHPPTLPSSVPSAFKFLSSVFNDEDVCPHSPPPHTFGCLIRLFLSWLPHWGWIELDLSSLVGLVAVSFCLPSLTSRVYIGLHLGLYGEAWSCSIKYILCVVDTHSNLDSQSTQAAGGISAAVDGGSGMLLGIFRSADGILLAESYLEGMNGV